MTTAMEIYAMASAFMVGFALGGAWAARIVMKRALSRERAADFILCMNAEGKEVHRTMDGDLYAGYPTMRPHE